MAISLSIKKFNNREYAYIVENYRDPATKRPTSRTLESFGRLDKLLAEDPDAMSKLEARVKELQANSRAYSNIVKERMLSGVNVSPEPSKRSSCLTCTPAIFHPLWERLGMAAYFKNFRRNHDVSYDLEKTVFFSCMSRLIKPASKLSSWRHRNMYLTDFSEIELQQMYDSLGVLAQHKDNIIRRLNKSIDAMYKRDLTVALYDVSTFYFESFLEGDLRRRGMSKEHRTQETQVVLGLLIDADGVPFTYELFPGNTGEVRTLIEVIEKFQRSYKIKDVIVVADSGLNQLVNLDALQNKGLRFIVGYPPYIKLKVSEQKKLLDEEDWLWHRSDDGDQWGYKTLPLAIDKTYRNHVTGTVEAAKFDATCIGTFSRRRFEHDLRELTLKWNRAANLVEKGAAAVAASSRSGYKAFIKVDTTSPHLNQKLYDKRRTWCGYTALLTNIKDPDPQWVYRKLRQLWRIEDNFRMLKTNLEARPVFVWTDEHIRGHFVLNYIALVMQKVFMKQLQERGLTLSATEIVEALESMKIQHVSGLKKANSHVYTCGNLEVEAATATDESGDKKALSALCDEILIACGMEPLNAVETASTIRKKLRLKLPMK